MRILFAITRGEIGGAQEHVRILASGYAARGHAVGVLTEARSSLADQLENAGIEFLEWPDIVRRPDPVRDVRARRQLRDAVHRFRPDVLHLHSSKAGVVGRRLLPRPGVTVFTCHHAPYGPQRQWTHRIVGRVVDQLTLPHLDGIVSVGARDMPLLRKLAPGVPMMLVRNAVPLPERPLAAPPNHTALWVARLQQPKDPLLLIEAWDHVVAAVPDARLVMCGTGPLEPDVRAAARRSRGAIEVLGRVDDLDGQRARASVFVLATRVEGGITMATLESMVHGLVPVVSDAGDAFLLEHARCGVVVQPRSARALSDALVGLFLDPERLAAMRTQALRFSREEWTTEDMVDATLGFYEELRKRT